MKRWYVVYTHANSESKARDHLLRQGFVAILPTYKRWRRHARRQEVVERPLFPRYLFVALDMLEQRWRPILSTVGVCDVVRRQAEMFAEQTIAYVTNAGARIRVGAGVDRDIALRVHAHRAVGKVGRPDPHKDVVHDHHL